MRDASLPNDLEMEREVVAAPGWLRARMGLAPALRVLHLACLHASDGAAYQFEDRWINLAALPAAEAADFTGEGPNEWLVRAVPYSEVEISFLATAADARVGGFLDMAEGEPVFTAERTTWWEGQALTHVRLYFARGHRMTTRY